jgi:hypothetical protein
MGFTQPLTEMSTRSRKILFLRSKPRPVRRANNHADCVDKVRSLTSHNPIDLHCHGGFVDRKQQYIFSIT